MIKINSLYSASFNPLNRDTEHVLAEKVKNGDAAARETLIRSNIRFALSEARKYQGHGLDFDDLCSEATAGLIKAVDHFDSSRNVRFITCAVLWIKNEVLASINKCGYTQRLSNNDYRAMIELRKNLHKYQDVMDENERLNLAASSTGITYKKALELLKTNSPCISLDAPEENKNKNSTICSFLNMLYDSATVLPEDAAINACFKQEFYKKLNSCSKVDREIFILHNGFDGYKAHSFTQLGKMYGRTRQWAFLKEQAVERRLYEELKDWIA